MKLLFTETSWNILIDVWPVMRMTQIDCSRPSRVFGIDEPMEVPLGILSVVTN